MKCVTNLWMESYRLFANALFPLDSTFGCKLLGVLHWYLFFIQSILFPTNTWNKITINLLFLYIYKEIKITIQVNSFKYNLWKWVCQNSTCVNECIELHCNIATDFFDLHAFLLYPNSHARKELLWKLWLFTKFFLSPIICEKVVVEDIFRSFIIFVFIVPCLHKHLGMGNLEVFLPHLEIP